MVPEPGDREPSDRARYSFVVLNITLFVASIGVGIVVPLLPIYAEKMGATGLGLGIFFASFSVARGLVMPATGKLSDRLGRKLFIALGLFFYSLLSLAYVSSRDIYALTLSRTLQGIAAAMLVPISLAYGGDLAPKGKEGTYLGTLNVSLFGGFGFGPFLGGVISDRFGIDASFYAMGGMSLMTLLLVLIALPGSPMTAAGKERRFLPLARLIKERPLMGVLSFRLANALGRGLFMSFLPLFAALKAGLDDAEIGILISANILITAALQAATGKLADRVSRRLLVVAGGIAYSVLFALLPLSTDFYTLLGISLVLGMAGAVPLPAATAIMTDWGPDYGMGTLMAAFSVAQSVGLIVGPILGGILMDAWGLPSVFYMAGAAGILGCWDFHRRTADLRREEGISDSRR